MQFNLEQIENYFWHTAPRPCCLCQAPCKRWILVCFFSSFQSNLQRAECSHPTASENGVKRGKFRPKTRTSGCSLPTGSRCRHFLCIVLLACGKKKQLMFRYSWRATDCLFWHDWCFCTPFPLTALQSYQPFFASELHLKSEGNISILSPFPDNHFFSQDSWF